MSMAYLSGGAVAQSFVLAHPERVRSAAFIATTSTGSEIMANRATIAENSAGGVASHMGQTIGRWFLPAGIAKADEDPISKEAWMVGYARAGLQTARIEEWAAAWRAMAKLDCEARLGEINVPIIVLAGTQDMSTPPAVMKRTCEGCKLGEYKELDHGMHLFVLYNAEAAAAELIAFRDRVDGILVQYDKLEWTIFDTSHLTNNRSHFQKRQYKLDTTKGELPYVVNLQQVRIVESARNHELRPGRTIWSSQQSMVVYGQSCLKCCRYCSSIVTSSRMHRLDAV